MNVFFVKLLKSIKQLSYYFYLFSFVQAGPLQFTNSVILMMSMEGFDYSMKSQVPQFKQ